MRLKAEPNTPPCGSNRLFPQRLVSNARGPPRRLRHSLPVLPCITLSVWPRERVTAETPRLSQRLDVCRRGLYHTCEAPNFTAGLQMSGGVD